MSADALPDELIQRFRDQTAERLARAESIWFSLLQGSCAEVDAAGLLRLIHTLKGDARLVGFADVDLVCHKLEDLLAVARDVTYAVPDDVDLLVTMSFHFIGLLTRRRARTPVGGIDLEGFVREVDQAVLAARALERSTSTAPEGVPVAPLDDATLDQESRLARAATLAFLEHLGASGASRLRLHRLWKLLQQEVAQASSTLLDPLVKRHVAAVDGLCEQLGKLVDIDVDTRGLCVTRRVADALDVGLLHCVRNALDHGLERPEARSAAGKPPRGVIRITAAMDGDVLELAVEDDGRGFEHDAIVRRARALGLVEELTCAGMSTLDVEELLFRPGLSTAPEAGCISGRGVGLDAVRAVVRKVGGEVSAHARPGGGARLVMRVPAHVHHVQVHVFDARPGVLVAIPATWVVAARVHPGRSMPGDPGSDAAGVRGPQVVDALEALGIAERAAKPGPHVLMLQWGPLRAEYAAASLPRLAMADRICPSAPNDPMEVVMVQGQEVLLLRPDRLAGAAGANGSCSGERATRDAVLHAGGVVEPSPTRAC